MCVLNIKCIYAHDNNNDIDNTDNTNNQNANNNNDNNIVQAGACVINVLYY